MNLAERYAAAAQEQPSSSTVEPTIARDCSVCHTVSESATDVEEELADAFLLSTAETPLASAGGSDLKDMAAVRPRQDGVQTTAADHITDSPSALRDERQAHQPNVAGPCPAAAAVAASAVIKAAAARAVLVDWMTSVGEALQLGPEALRAAVELLDGFTARQVPAPPDALLQLVALTCLSLATRQQDEDGPAHYQHQEQLRRPTLTPRQWASLAVDPVSDAPLYEVWSPPYYQVLTTITMASRSRFLFGPPLVLLLAWKAQESDIRRMEWVLTETLRGAAIAAGASGPHSAARAGCPETPPAS